MVGLVIGDLVFLGGVVVVWYVSHRKSVAFARRFADSKRVNVSTDERPTMNPQIAELLNRKDAEADAANERDVDEFCGDRPFVSELLTEYVTRAKPVAMHDKLWRLSSGERATVKTVEYHVREAEYRYLVQWDTLSDTAARPMAYWESELGDFWSRTPIARPFAR